MFRKIGDTFLVLFLFGNIQHQATAHQDACFIVIQCIDTANVHDLAVLMKHTKIE